MQDYRIRVNNKAVDRISVLDRGLQYGDGLFETVAVCKGVPLLWHRHWQRLEQGCQRLGFSVPDQGRLQNEITIITEGVDTGVLKLVVTRGCSHRGYAPDANSACNQIVYLFPWPDWPGKWRQQGVDVRLCATRLGMNTQLAGIKHLNRMEQVLARMEWQDEVAEGLLQDQEDNIIEATSSNLFAVFDNQLYTPDLSRCGVAGVMRAEVMEHASSMKINVNIEKLSLARLQSADEVFLTNSIIGIWPVKRIDSTKYPVGVITKSIQNRLGSAYCEKAL